MRGLSAWRGDRIGRVSGFSSKTSAVSLHFVRQGEAKAKPGGASEQTLASADAKFGRRAGKSINQVLLRDIPREHKSGN
jgi:hypothetical protein